MNDQQDERDFDKYLAGDSPVSRQYQALPGDEPPPELDAQILDAAEAELKVVPMRRPWQRWATAAGVAATVLLAFTLVMQLVIRPAGEPGPADQDAAAVRLAEEARVAQDDKREALESRAPAVMAQKSAAPTMPPGRTANQLGEEMLRDEVAGMASGAAMADLAAPAGVAPAAPAERPAAGAAGEADDPQLVAAIAVVREARAVPAAERRRDLTAGSLVVSPPDAHLDEVLRLYDTGDFDGAAWWLDEFLATYPDHPVSLRLVARAD